METHMNKPEISSIAPFFIVQDLAAALSFYRDRLDDDGSARYQILDDDGR
jgi:hypothetical protein